MGQTNLILYSGGLDSYITLAYVKNKIDSVLSDEEYQTAYVKLGHRYQEHELHAISRTRPDTLILEGLNSLGMLEEESAYILHRNAFLVLRASESLFINKIWLTVQKDEMSIPDRSHKFMRKMTDVLHALDRPITVLSPWTGTDKTGMVQWYLENNLSVDLLKNTRSCYSESGIPCGCCAACIRRYVAMSLNGIKEDHIVDPKKSDLARTYLVVAEEGIKYSEERSSQIIEVLG